MFCAIFKFLVNFFQRDLDLLPNDMKMNTHIEDPSENNCIVSLKSMKAVRSSSKLS